MFFLIPLAPNFQSQVESLEEQLGSSEEKSSQLQHELTAKNELLRVYSRVYESQEDLSTSSSSLPLSPENGNGLGLTLNHHGFIGDASSSSSSGRASDQGQCSIARRWMLVMANVWSTNSMIFR